MALGTLNWQQEFEQALAAAHPRLMRLARLNGLAPEAADDAAQETLIVAWQQLAHLRQPDRFDAWLDGICRNICQHQRRSVAREQAHALPFSQHDARQLAEALDDVAASIAGADDPLAALEREDLQTLLDQALGSLSAEARVAVELCYLAEMPQREAAARLGLTVSVLEARLHRVRQQLRRVLGGELREAAEALGLSFTDDPPLGWREARQWCMFCGQRRMHGIFETPPDGTLELRMRCPVCCGPDEAYINTGGGVDLRGSRAFGPALKRTIQTIYGYYAEALAHGGRQNCHTCGQPIQVAVVPITALFPAAPVAIQSHFSMSYTCPRCQTRSDAFAIAALYTHPAMQDFIDRHPRWMIEPEQVCDFEGQQAIRFVLADVANAARLTIFAARATLEILATFST